MKRGNGGATVASPSKKAKDDAEFVEKSIERISIALRNAEHLPSSVQDILCDTLQYFLVAESDRHRYQQQMVDALAGELSSIEAGMQAAILDADELAVLSEKEKDACAAASKEIEGVWQAKSRVYSVCKTALADSTLAYNAAKSEQEDAQLGTHTVGKDMEDATETKDVVTQLLGTIERRHETPEAIQETIDSLVKHVNLTEEALLVALPSVLGKDSSDHQSFDRMVMEKTRDTTKARIRELEVLIASYGPKLQAFAETACAAAQTVRPALERMMSHANAFRDIQTEYKEVEAKRKHALQALKAATVQLKESARRQEAARAELDLFRDGALDSFRALCARSVTKTVTVFESTAKEEKIQTIAPIAAGLAGA